MRASFARRGALAFALATAASIGAAQPGAGDRTDPPAAASASGGVAADAPPPGTSLPDTSPPDTIAQRLIGCTVCHGTQDVIVKGNYYPRLFGKPAGYLYNQLVNFREGRRAYPLMTYLVGNLPEPYLREIAEYFAGQHPPYPPPEPPQADAAAMARGRRLVFDGEPARDVPACAACHGRALTGVAPSIPGLLGLPKDYISAQFGAWRNRARHTVAPDCMAQVAERLSTDDIAAAAAWLAAQPAPGQALPASAPANDLPMRCGSVESAAVATRGER
ncbi:MAG: c-type cytochrome [Burkholderiaceae bacterium]